MKVFISQFYIFAGVEYPFSHRFQRFLSEELSNCIAASDTFIRKYSVDFDIVFRMSAKAGLADPEVFGPTVFKRDKSVEFTIFVPFHQDETRGNDLNRRILHILLNQIVDVLKRLEIDVTSLILKLDSLVESIVADSSMTVSP